MRYLVLLREREGEKPIDLLRWRLGESMATIGNLRRNADIIRIEVTGTNLDKILSEWEDEPETPLIFWRHQP